MICSCSGNQYNSYGGGGQQHFMPPQAHGGYGGGGPAYQGQTHQYQLLFTIFLLQQVLYFVDIKILVLIKVVKYRIFFAHSANNHHQKHNNLYNF
jgi:hypothetical protein